MYAVMRKRGPHKGDGGRPPVPLRKDFPDNMIVAIAIWLSKGKRVITVPFIEKLTSGYKRPSLARHLLDGTRLSAGGPKGAGYDCVRPRRMAACGTGDGPAQPIPEYEPLNKREQKPP
jgi:hypothetical protein